MFTSLFIRRLLQEESYVYCQEETQQSESNSESLSSQENPAYVPPLHVYKD
jgi:hypothetical protein